MGDITSDDLICALTDVADAMALNRDMLCALDGKTGDADHGIAMDVGFSAVRKALAGLGNGATPTDVFNTAARSFLSAVGASCGPLYATAFMRAGASFKGQNRLSDADAAILIAAMAEGIATRGKAAPGDKTMLDAWVPAADAARAASPAPFTRVLQSAAAAAESGAQATKGLQAKMGRAARLGERSIGHVDPGAMSTAILLQAFAKGFG